jgi:hypothetical protein
MSYLQLPSINLADFSKGTISLWFRFSDDSVAKAREYAESYQPPDFGDSATGPDIFKATIPLVTFGRKVMAHTYGFVSHAWPFPTGGTGASTADSVAKDDSPCEPSHLGLSVPTGHDDQTTVALRMVFQTETRAQVQGLLTEASDIHWEQDPPGSGLYQQYTVIKDISYVRTASPETFEINPTFEVSADKWHHLLVSFDFSTAVDVVAIKGSQSENVERDTIKSVCQLWYAFDDENKDGKDNMGDSWGFHDPNDVVPITAIAAAISYISPSIPTDSTGRPTVTGQIYDTEYHWAASPIPMSTGPVGLPASADYVETIYHVEMAEFQFFAGLVIDTSNQQKRRAFVDANGNPVTPEDTEKALGRKPDILLHGSSNWQQGKNTGTTGITKNDKGEDIVIEAGQFRHVGLIKKYTPDPSLENTTA